MMKIIIPIFIFLAGGLIQAQELIINDSIQLKKGFYKDFSEFKFNKPSIEFDYEITVKKCPDLLDSTQSFNYYKIKIEKDNGKLIGDIFGFCDGEEIYIISQTPSEYITPLTRTNFQLSSKTKFLRIEYLGRYCYYTDNGFTSTTSDFGTIKSSCDPRPSVVDIISGKRFLIDKYNIDNLIGSDSILLSEFNTEKQKNKKIKKYIVKYSEINKSVVLAQINFTKKLETDLYFKESDISISAYFDRIKRFEYSPIFKEIEIWQDKNKNNQLKFIGAKAMHTNGNNFDYFYRIGTWFYFHKNGQIKKLVDYDLLERKNGRFQTFTENGDIIENKVYRLGVEIL